MFKKLLAVIGAAVLMLQFTVPAFAEGVEPPVLPEEEIVVSSEETTEPAEDPVEEEVDPLAFPTQLASPTDVVLSTDTDLGGISYEIKDPYNGNRSDPNGYIISVYEKTGDVLVCELPGRSRKGNIPLEELVAEAGDSETVVLNTEYYVTAVATAFGEWVYDEQEEEDVWVPRYENSDPSPKSNSTKPKANPTGMVFTSMGVPVAPAGELLLKDLLSITNPDGLTFTKFSLSSTKNFTLSDGTKLDSAKLKPKNTNVKAGTTVTLTAEYKVAGKTKKATTTVGVAGIVVDSAEFNYNFYDNYVNVGLQTVPYDVYGVPVSYEAPHDEYGKYEFNYISNVKDETATRTDLFIIDGDGYLSMTDTTGVKLGDVFELRVEDKRDSAIFVELEITIGSAALEDLYFVDDSTVVLTMATAGDKNKLELDESLIDFYPSEATLTDLKFTSGNPAVAEVKDGFLVAKAPGKTMLFATDTAADGTEKTGERIVYVSDGISSTDAAKAKVMLGTSQLYTPTPVPTASTTDLRPGASALLSVSPEDAENTAVFETEFVLSDATPGAFTLVGNRVTVLPGAPDDATANVIVSFKYFDGTNVASYNATYGTIAVAAPDATGVSIQPDITLYNYAEGAITATTTDVVVEALPAGAKLPADLKFASNDKKIVDVTETATDGKITLTLNTGSDKKYGKTSIVGTYTLNGATKTVKMTVNVLRGVHKVEITNSPNKDYEYKYSGIDRVGNIISVGSKFKLTTKLNGGTSGLKPAESTVNWSTDNDKASVDAAGYIYGYVPGMVRVKAASPIGSSGSEAYVDILVVNPYASVTGYSSAITMNAGTSKTLKLEPITTVVQPYEPVSPEVADFKWEVKSAGSTGLKVDDNGVVSITAGSTGTSKGVKVVASNPYTGKSATFTIKVVATTASVTDIVKLTNNGATSTDIEVGKTFSFKVNCEGADDATPTYKTVVWSVKDPTVASVDANGKVKGLRFGTTEVYARAFKADGTLPAVTDTSDLLYTFRLTVSQPLSKATVYDIFSRKTPKAFEVSNDYNAQFNGKAYAGLMLTPWGETSNYNSGIITLVDKVEEGYTSVANKAFSSDPEIATATFNPSTRQFEILPGTKAGTAELSAVIGPDRPAGNDSNGFPYKKAGKQITVKFKVTNKVYPQYINLGNPNNREVKFAVDNQLTLAVKKSTTLKLDFDSRISERKIIGWYSSNPSVLKVDKNGKVTALAEGMAYVYPEFEKQYLYTSPLGTTVRVVNSILFAETYAKDVALLQKNFSIERGKEFTLDAALTGLGSKADYASALTWSTSNAAVVNFKAGNTGVGASQTFVVDPAAKKNATATITVKDPYTGKSKKLTVKALETETLPGSLTIKAPKGYTIASKAMDVFTGNYVQFGLTFGKKPSDANVTWSVANGTGTASITNDGKLLPKTAGIVTVTATHNRDATAKDTITLNIANRVENIRVSETRSDYEYYSFLTGQAAPDLQLNAEVNAFELNGVSVPAVAGTLTWTSSNKKIAEVTAETDTTKAKLVYKGGKGTATITATYKEGKRTVKGTFKVYSGVIADEMYITGPDTVNVNKATKFNVNLYSANGKVTEKGVRWSVESLDDPSYPIATMSGNSLKFTTPGLVKLTATYLADESIIATHYVVAVNPVTKLTAQQKTVTVAPGGSVTLGVKVDYVKSQVDPAYSKNAAEIEWYVGENDAKYLDNYGESYIDSVIPDSDGMAYVSFDVAKLTTTKAIKVTAHNLHSNKKVTFNLNIKGEYVPVEDITLNQTSIFMLGVNKTTTLKATLLPNEKKVKATNRDIIWLAVDAYYDGYGGVNYNPSVHVSVDAKGKVKGLQSNWFEAPGYIGTYVVAIPAEALFGSSGLYYSDLDSYLSARCEIKNIGTPVSKVKANSKNTYMYSYIASGGTNHLYLTFTPADATVKDIKVISSSNPNVISAEDLQAGYDKGMARFTLDNSKVKGTGTTKVTIATVDGNKKATFSIIVTP